MNPLHVRVGLERSSDSRSLAWALDFPGAFSFGNSDTEALERLPESLMIYEHWVGQHTDLNWVKLAKFDLQVEEKFDTLLTDESTTLTAFFQDDRRPLDTLEIEQALLIHAWQRQDLLETVKNLTPDLMTRMLPGQRWNINGILNHIGRAETRCLA
ncbi:MAG TPA: hypothetical protein VLR89_07705, partial [Anaerolineaceae bacterium]|nr:hypothetical protein [Anaerolineaceae bacterium]